MSNPDISITKDAQGGVDLSVEAGTTSVPMLYEGGDWDTLPSDVQNFWTACLPNYPQNCALTTFNGPNPQPDFMQLGYTLAGNKLINITAFPFASGSLALEGLTAIAPLVGDKAYATNSSWSFRTLTASEMEGADKCLTSTPGIKGIVTTNSTAYSAGPPALENGTLNYRVASPHFNPDGTTPFKGTYNLVIRSDVARCIYGFSSAPISASISVISSDGSNDVATTAVGEKNGWLSLSADNFEFSSPTIAVKLSQAVPTSSPSPTSVLTVSSATSKATRNMSAITCMKSSTVKKIVGINPVCPHGYKKK
jgi:hypothetical protein